MRPRLSIFVLSFLLVLSLVGCDRNQQKEPLHAALVISGELGDHAFNDSAKAGCDALVDTWKIGLDIIEIGRAHV